MILRSSSIGRGSYYNYYYAYYSYVYASFHQGLWHNRGRQQQFFSSKSSRRSAASNTPRSNGTLIAYLEQLYRKSRHDESLQIRLLPDPLLKLKHSPTNNSNNSNNSNNNNSSSSTSTSTMTNPTNIPQNDSNSNYESSKFRIVSLQYAINLAIAQKQDLMEVSIPASIAEMTDSYSSTAATTPDVTTAHQNHLSPPPTTTPPPPPIDQSRMMIPVLTITDVKQLEYQLHKKQKKSASSSTVAASTDQTSTTTTAGPSVVQLKQVGFRVGIAPNDMNRKLKDIRKFCFVHGYHVQVTVQAHSRYLEKDDQIVMKTMEQIIAMLNNNNDNDTDSSTTTQQQQQVELVMPPSIPDPEKAYIGNFRVRPKSKKK